LGYAGIVDVKAGAPIAVGQEVIAYYTQGTDPSYQGCVLPKPPPTGGGALYVVRGRAITGAAAMGDTAKILLMNYTN
jgi:hypothetical protein